jgi:hypothetical protein
LRIREQETRLTLHEHDDDDDDGGGDGYYYYYYYYECTPVTYVTMQRMI